MAGDLAGLLTTAQGAMAEGDWTAARAWYDEALALDPACADALYGHGDALWWLGETRAAVRAWEQAFVAYRVQGDDEAAGYVAVSLYFVYRTSLGNVAAARGWLARGASLVEQCAESPLPGWVLVMRADDSTDDAAAERWAREARALGRTHGDRDLELCATSFIGAALVGQGRIEEGMALLDEAMAGSLAGEGERLDTVVFTSCVMITACSRVAEVERVVQWVKASDTFCHRYGAPHLFTLCRTYYGAVLFSAGRWREAEEELEAALRIGVEAEPALRGAALGHLALLRLAQGRPEEAGRLVEGCENHVALVPTFAEIQLASGRAGVAAEWVRRRLREIGEETEAVLTGSRAGADGVLEQAHLLEVLVAAELERNALDDARADAERLARLAAGSGLLPVRAMAERALGAVLVATGDVAEALTHLEAAVSLFRRCDYPLDIARCQLRLAAVPGRDREVAVAEARAALATFGALGAATDVDRTAALLRSYGERVGPTGPRSDAVLSAREHEVLALVGRGLTNRQIGERLFISSRTVEQHVRSVLTKLGCSNRAEAAACAARGSAAD